jgi:lysophospholipase L1-like esterase
MKRIIYLLALISFQAVAQCPTGTNPLKAKSINVCDAVISNLTNGIIKSSGDSLKTATPGSDYATPGSLSDSLDNYLKLSGGIMTGAISAGGQPSVDPAGRFLYYSTGATSMDFGEGALFSLDGLSSLAFYDGSLGVGLNYGGSSTGYIKTSNLSGGNKTYQLPNISGDVLTHNSTATLTNKTWNGVVIGSSYGGAGTVNGILKASGSGVVSAAVDQQDYLTPDIAQDNTRFVTGATRHNLRNKTSVGNVLNYKFSNGLTNWVQTGSASTFSQSGNNLQVTGGNNDFVNNYKYTDFQFAFNAPQIELIGIKPTVDGSTALNGIGVGWKSYDGIIDIVCRLDLSNTATRGKLLIYQVTSGAETLIADSGVNLLSYTTNNDTLNLKINRRKNGFIEAKVFNQTNNTSLTVVSAASVSISFRSSYGAIYHFGGTQLIAGLNVTNTHKKNSTGIIVGDSIGEAWSTLFITEAVGDWFSSSGSGNYSSGLAASIDAYINSGATYAIIMIGANDAISSVSSVDYIANVRKFINAMVEVGTTPVICYVTPTTNAGRNVFIQAYNTALVAEYNGIWPLVNTHDILSVGNSPTGLLSSTYDSGDGTHLNSTGLALVVSTIQTTCSSYIRSSPASTKVSNTFSSGTTNTFNGGVVFGNGLAIGSSSGLAYSGKMINISHTDTLSSVKQALYMDFTSSYNSTPSAGSYGMRINNILTGSQNYSGILHTGMRTIAENASSSSGASSVGILQGHQVSLFNSGSGRSASAVPIHIDAVTNTGGGSVGTIYSVLIEDQTVATGTMAGVRSQISSGTNKWNLFITGTASNTYQGRSFFGGTTAPTAQVHIAAGTATASTAPLKFTSGTNLTTPEAGAVEFDGTNYFATASTTRYTLAKTLTNTATLNFDLTSVNYQDLTITVTGAADGDAGAIGIDPASVTANVQFEFMGCTTNTVTIRASRIDVASGADPGSGTFRASVIKY